MSGSGYYFYPQEPPPNFPMVNTVPDRNWSSWPLEQHHQQYANFPRRSSFQNTYSTLPPPPPPPNHTNTNMQLRPQSFYNANNRHFHSPEQTRFQYPYHHRPYKRARNNKDTSSDNNGEYKSKMAKKKKKPLSQHMSSKREWTTDEAEKALVVEKEYNKRYKNQTLIIKFPDLELNRDIVSKYHSAIENVHFQQPSTPRFCFVTLHDGVNPDEVIKDLNRMEFGNGYLTAEHKREREEDQSVTADDIDPYTLYVGNLAQEVTKDDMVKTYPKCKRIDIGYAKKMKYTRYAFVSFKNVDDAIQAFRDTHNTQMYSKSLIVRFRRLHGTIGMPGETKIAGPKAKSDIPPANKPSSELVGDSDANNAEKVVNSERPWPNEIDLSLVKEEIQSSDEDELENIFLAGETGDRMKRLKTVKPDEDVKPDDEIPKEAFPKTEPQIIKEEQEDDEAGDDCGNEMDNEPLVPVDFKSMLHQLEDHSHRIDSLRKSGP